MPWEGVFAPVLVVGELVGQTYRVVRLIGTGGMGEVYEAVHESLSRRVAIKTLRTELEGESELISRFRREAEASAALGHPNIVQVTDFIIDPGRPPVMVMELLEGRTLRELVTSAKELEASRAVFIALQVLSGLAAAHRAGIIHRDVKPANVFLQKTLAVRDHVKLLDFGLAKLMESQSFKSKEEPMTERGRVLGTRAYMAPEQEAGATNIDARADLYAVGATLYYALSGRRPREIHQAARDRMPLDLVAPRLPRKLIEIVERALAIQPRDRFANAEQMAEALMAFSSTTSGIGKATYLPGQIDAPAPELVAKRMSVMGGGPITAPTALPLATPTPPDSLTTETAPSTERDARFTGESFMESTLDDTLKTEKPLNVTEDSLQLETKRMQAISRSNPVAPVPIPAPSEPRPGSLPPPRMSQPSMQSGSQFPSFGPSTVRRPAARSSKLDFVLLLTAFVVLLAAALWAARYFAK